MNPASPGVTSVERFADTVASLAAPFAVREMILRAAGLDERTWAHLEDEWIARLDADGALADRYIAHYEAIVRGPSTPRAEAAPPSPAGLGLLIPEAAPWRSEVASVSQALGAGLPALLPAPLPERPPFVGPPVASWRIDGTLEPDAGAALRAVLPFSRGPSNLPRSIPAAANPPVDPARVGATVDLPAGLRFLGALPFPLADTPHRTPSAAPDATLELGASLTLPQPGAAPAIAVPGKRLHRFDAKTGEPLPVPMWVDDPAEPKKPA